MKRYTNSGLLMLCLAVFVFFVCVYASQPADTPVTTCAKGQQAELVGFGKEADGTYLAAYACDKVSER